MKPKSSRGRIAQVMSCIAVLFSMQLGCLVLDEGHCLANGGDLACSGQICLVQTESTIGTISSDAGCADRDRFLKNPKGHVHAEFGLPAAFELDMGPDDRGVSGLDTVEGILFEAQEEQGIVDLCSLEDPNLADESDDLDVRYSEIQPIRNRLENEGKDVRRNDVILFDQDGESNAVKDYNRAVAAWLDKCEKIRAEPGPAPES